MQIRNKEEVYQESRKKQDIIRDNITDARKLPKKEENADISS